MWASVKSMTKSSFRRVWLVHTHATMDVFSIWCIYIIIYILYKQKQITVIKKKKKFKGKKLKLKQTIKLNYWEWKNDCICSTVDSSQMSAWRRWWGELQYGEGDRKRRVFPKHPQTWCKRWTITQCVSKLRTWLHQLMPTRPKWNVIKRTGKITVFCSAAIM